jgi:hypothetical protein
MNDYLDPDIVEMLRVQQEKSGLNVTLLESGTKIVIETINSIYQLIVVDGREITIMGGMTKSGEIRFPKPISATFIGSSWGGSLLKPDWIGHDMSIEVLIPSEGNQVLTSSNVQNVEIEAPDGRWNYSMDWNK